MENMQENSGPSQPRSSWFTLISSPSQYFGTRKNRVPWLWPLIISSIVSAIIMFLQVPYVLKSPQMTKALSAVPSAQASLVESMSKISTIVGGVLAPWLAVFVGGLVLWLVIKLFGISIKYMQTVGILASAYIITLIGTVLAGIVTIATGTLTVGFLSLNEILNVAGRFGNLLAALSVFWLWHLYVVTVGVSEVGNVRRGRAFASALVVSVLGLLLSLLSTTHA